MRRTTPAGTATVRLLCRRFGLSRQAYYGAQRPPTAPRSLATVAKLPARPAGTTAAELLAAIRAVVAREPAWGVRKVWATLRREGLRADPLR
jgi:hypothetical protein